MAILPEGIGWSQVAGVDEAEERVRKCCDGLISIPMKGKLDSLNASNATAVILYEVVR